MALLGQEGAQKDYYYYYKVKAQVTDGAFGRDVHASRTFPSAIRPLYLHTIHC
jgi:hypothetical protein